MRVESTAIDDESTNTGRFCSETPDLATLDECINFDFEGTGQIVIFQQDAVLERLMESSGSSSASWTICPRTGSGMRFQTRSGREDRSSNASGPPLW
jgi:hypothetical protein